MIKAIPPSITPFPIYNLEIKTPYSLIFTFTSTKANALRLLYSTGVINLWPYHETALLTQEKTADVLITQKSQ